jgi:hypothetical protein
MQHFGRQRFSMKQLHYGCNDDVSSTTTTKDVEMLSPTLFHASPVLANFLKLLALYF